MALNLPLLYFVGTEEYCQTSPNKKKSPNLWHITSILICCIYHTVFPKIVSQDGETDREREKIKRGNNFSLEIKRKTIQERKQFKALNITKAKLLLLKLIQIFAWAVLVMKKLEIKKTKTTWYSTFKTGLGFFDFSLFHY